MYQRASSLEHRPSGERGVVGGGGAGGEVGVDGAGEGGVQGVGDFGREGEGFGAGFDAEEVGGGGFAGDKVDPGGRAGASVAEGLIGGDEEQGRGGINEGERETEVEEQGVARGHATG